MYLVGSWVAADTGVMVVFAFTLVIVTAIGAYVVRGALARSRQVDLSARHSEEAGRGQQGATKSADRIERYQIGWSLAVEDLRGGITVAPVCMDGPPLPKA